MRLPFSVFLSLFMLMGGTFARANGVIAWPIPPLPPGANSAISPTPPQMDWFTHFQNNINASRKQPAVDLIFDGDSITDFWMSHGRRIWTQRYAPLHAFDFGIEGGGRTENLLWRLQNGQVDGLHPKLVLLMIGTNNLGSNTPQEIAAGIKADLEEYFKHCPGTTILLQAVLPRGVKADDPDRARIKALNQLISPFADGKKVLYVDFGKEFLEPDGTLNSADILPDLIHPSQKGYQIWADAVQAKIDQFFPGARH